MSLKYEPSSEQGDEYFFSTNDKDRQSWMDSPGHAYIKPIAHGEACTLIQTEMSSWRRGFIAPCKQVSVSYERGTLAALCKQVQRESSLLTTYWSESTLSS